MNILNLTPHAINLPGRTIPPSGTVARCAEETAQAGNIDGIEIVNRTYGAVTDLPAPQAETFYIVSALVRAALPHRKDLLSPGDVVRDADGKIIGAKNLVSN